MRLHGRIIIESVDCLVAPRHSCATGNIVPRNIPLLAFYASSRAWQRLLGYIDHVSLEPASSVFRISASLTTVRIPLQAAPGLAINLDWQEKRRFTEMMQKEKLRRGGRGYTHVAPVISFSLAINAVSRDFDDEDDRRGD